MESKLISFLESQRRRARWEFLSRSLINEIVAGLNPDDARRMFIRAGLGAGQALSLPHCDSISEMERAANQHWSTLGWGLVSFTERQDHLEIRHMAVPGDAPSSEVFGAFLEGVYQQWFYALGAGSHLNVRQHTSDETDMFVFRLAT